MKLLTLEDYEKAGDEFWPKYDYVSLKLGTGATVEDILKVMEAIGGVAIKMKVEEKLNGPFGFLKTKEEEEENGL